MFDWLTKIQISIMAHTPGRFWAYPGYPDSLDSRTGAPAPSYAGGEYNFWVILGLIPNLGQAFVSLNTVWAPVFKFLFFLATSSLAVDFDSPDY